MPITPSNPFKWRHYPGEVILCSSPLLPRLPSGLRACRRTDAGAGASRRWELWSGGPVQAYGPELEKRCRPHLKPTAKSYRVDETYIRIQREDKYLYRAVDKDGQTIDFLLTARRDARGRQALLPQGTPAVLGIRTRASSMSIRTLPTQPRSKPSKRRAYCAVALGCVSVSI